MTTAAGHDETKARRTKLVAALSAAAVVLLAFIYVSPVWWVSLKAPQYPADAFPSGVRIQFHMNGVFNGCELLARKEIVEDKALDCVHEMDAINHFVGMFPIASGGVVEKFYSPFLMSFLAIMIIGFAITNVRLRLAVMGTGFAAIAIWMWLAFFGANGIRYQSAGYLDAMVVSLGQGQEEEGEEQSSVIAQLKKSLLESGVGAAGNSAELQKSLEEGGHVDLGKALGRLHEGTAQDAAGAAKTLKEILATAAQTRLAGKDLNIEILRQAFEADQGRKPAAARKPWTGRGADVAAWHHEKSLGRWFNSPEINGPIADRMATVAGGLFWLIVAGMAAMLVIGRNNGRWHYLLLIVPILLPVFFIIEYASWLWWYGHSLNAMGAFTLKPFMPTVFGQGKVAQFSTHSYPHIGFGLMLLSTACLTLALLIRRKQISDGDVQEAAR